VLSACLDLPAQDNVLLAGDGSQDQRPGAERKAVPSPFKTDNNGDYWIYMAICEDIGWTAGAGAPATTICRLSWISIATDSTRLGDQFQAFGSFRCSQRPFENSCLVE